MAETEAERMSDRFRAAYNGRDWIGMRELVADDIVLDDQQPARGFPQVRGADDFMDRMKQGVEWIPDRRITNLVMLAQQPSAYMVLMEFRGHDPVGGGEVAGDRITVTVMADGRLARVAFFDLDDEASALAYFDEVAAGA